MSEYPIYKMVYARNNIAVPSGGHYKLDPILLGIDQHAWKLSIFVKGEKKENEEGELEDVYSPVVLQVSEHEQQFFDDLYGTEMLLELGFHSRVFYTPITAFRFRTPDESPLPALIHFTAYA